MKSSKILVVCQHFWPESFRINDICDYFIEKGLDVDVLCGIPNYPSGRFFKGYSFFKNRRQIHKEVRINRAFEIPRGNNSNLRILLNYISFPLASIFHIPRLLFMSYDKIFIYQLSPVMMSISGILIGKIKKTETTMYVLDLWPENLFSVLKIKNVFLRKIATVVSRWHYKHVDKLVVLSNMMKNKLVQDCGIPEDKIIVLPQACEKIYETDVIDKDLQKRFSNGFNILFAGNISPAQSFETMMLAAQKLKDAGINDVNWIIVGDGMSKKEVETKTIELGLDNFYFEGVKPMEDIPKYSNIANLLVGCLVKSELLEATIPAKVMSYIASGKPIVLAMDGEVQDLVNETIKCGYASATEDAEELYRNIKKVYEMDGSERINLGNNAKKYHFKHLERNIILGQLYNFIFNKSSIH